MNDPRDWWTCRTGYIQDYLRQAATGAVYLSQQRFVSICKISEEECREMIRHGMPVVDVPGLGSRCIDVKKALAWLERSFLFFDEARVRTR